MELNTKTSIIDNILSDKSFKSILSAYKNDKTSGIKINFNNEYKNGLCDTIFVIKCEEKIQKIIFPIFSTQNTITWSNMYLKDIKANTPKELLADLEDHEIIDKIICPLYFYDTLNNEAIFLSVISCNDFVNKGLKGKNGYSTYFWNKDLPNKYSLNKKELISDSFINTLPFYSKKEIKEICKDYATKYHKRFADITKRSEQTKINNISSGLYAQISIYLDLLNNGHNVSMDWKSEDDLGIDIVLKLDNQIFNIDVKSTKDSNLKISKNRKETDFYAIVNTTKEPKLLGFLYKFDFWRSEILDTIEPEKINDMWIKPINSLELLEIDNLFSRFNTYRTLKMKKGSNLFDVQ